MHESISLKVFERYTISLVKKEEKAVMEQIEIQLPKALAESKQLYKAEKEVKKHEHRRYSQTMWCLGLMLGDGISIASILALLLTSLPHFHLFLRVLQNAIGIWDIRIVWFLLAILLWSVASRVTQIYDIQKATSGFRSAVNILFTLTLVFGAWLILTSPFLAQNMISYSTILLLCFLSTLCVLCIWRILFAHVMRLPRFRKRAVIVGVTPAGKTIANELRTAKSSFATVLGYIHEERTESQQEEGLTVLGDRSKLFQLGKDRLIDMVIPAIDYHQYPELFKIIIDMAQSGISVVPMTIAYEHATGKIPVEHVRDQWYLALPLEIVVSPLYMFWRKVIDITFGLVGSILLLLLLPIVVILIYIDSPGPIFYRQERQGLQGRPFSIYKFRSMHINAELKGHALWATEKDPRITRVGRIMRATHFDELPQVFNILRGDMSLVGPRPEREQFAYELEKTVPFYRCRLLVKPGLTGWAQVKYRYGNTNDDALVKVQYDLYYIKHQSFMLDIFIILSTVREVLFGHGV